MAEVTRVNGLACTAGTLYSLNAKAFLVTVKNAAASARDLRAEDDAVDEAVEMIVNELNPLMFFVTLLCFAKPPGSSPVGALSDSVVISETSCFFDIYQLK
jgi:uncharacterized protein (UPF0212 family)